MKLSETVNCFSVSLDVRETIDGDAILAFYYQNKGFCLDLTQAKELMPILENFIKTGELPE